ncbi:MAG: hypothetical protein BGO59_16255 [Spirosoma sp. 48-14]|nr:MAG: hypothetical protein BGO59_16255 [Spirosoma sp. 48-14]
MVKDVDTAKDYTHDIFIKVFEAFNTFQHRSSYATWLYSITHNYCLEQIRRNRVRCLPGHAWVDYGVDTDKADELDLYVERLFLVRKAMEALPAENKALLSLRYETGMSIKEIADLFNLSDDAVKMRLKRSRDRIKQLALHG